MAKKAEPERQQLPLPDPSTAVDDLPMQLRVGDLAFQRDEAWQVVGRVESTRAGKRARASVQLPGRPETSRVIDWAAHERVRVRRAGS